MKTNPVKSRFAVPAAIAFAGHAILFFGFTSDHPPVPVRSVIADTPPCTLQPPVEVEFQKPDDTDPTNPEPYVPKTTPTAATLPDIPTDVIPPGSIAIPAEPIQTGPIDPRLNRAPTDIVGPGGKENLGGVNLTRAMDLDNAPRAKFQVRPVYPYTMRQSGITGDVVVDFLVDEQGRVSDVRVLRSSHPEFDEPTVRAVSQWKFEPGKRHGRVVRFRMAQPIGFTLGAD